LTLTFKVTKDSVGLSEEKERMVALRLHTPKHIRGGRGGTMRRPFEEHVAKTYTHLVPRVIRTGERCEQTGSGRRPDNLTRTRMPENSPRTGEDLQKSAVSERLGKFQGETRRKRDGGGVVWWY
jgi:hypothetical protein